MGMSEFSEGPNILFPRLGIKGDVISLLETVES